MTLKLLSSQEFKDFQVEQAYQKALEDNSFLIESDRGILRDNIEKELNINLQVWVLILSSFLSAGLAIIHLLVIWGYTVLIFQWMGGKEEKLPMSNAKGTKIRKHRGSLNLAVHAFIPIALSTLANGLIILFRRNEVYLNMSSMEDLMERLNQPFSLYSLLTQVHLSLWLESFLNVFTNPLYWVFGWILGMGGKSLFGVSTRKGIGVVLIYLLLLVNYQWGGLRVAGMLAGASP